MIALPPGARIWLANGVPDMRKGMPGLSLLVQEGLGRDLHAGGLHLFRGRSGSMVKILWHNGVGMSLYIKKLERGRFIWPLPNDGALAISAAQLSMPLDHSWRSPSLSCGCACRLTRLKARLRRLSGASTVCGVSSKM